MRFFIAAWVPALGVALAVGAGECRAQAPYARPISPNPYSQPAYSPYLNLLRPGGNPAINYYGLVRPQQDFRLGLQQLQQQALGIDQGYAALDASAAGILTSGHHTSFMTHTRYFLNHTGQGAGPLRPGAGFSGTAGAGLSSGYPGAGGAAGFSNRGAQNLAVGRPTGGLR